MPALIKRAAALGTAGRRLRPRLLAAEWGGLVGAVVTYWQHTPKTAVPDAATAGVLLSIFASLFGAHALAITRSPARYLRTSPSTGRRPLRLTNW